jgi:uncharacterized protein (DUF1330 family)
MTVACGAVSMAAYLIGDIQVTDRVGYEEYRQKVPAVIAKYGGRYLARGGTTEVFEGEPKYSKATGCHIAASCWSFRRWRN